MMSNLKIGTRLALAFGGVALLVLLMMVMALSGLGAAEHALQGSAAGQAQSALAQLQSARAWTIGCGLAVLGLAHGGGPQLACQHRGAAQPGAPDRGDRGFGGPEPGIRI
jgi:hypothetical protein